MVGRTGVTLSAAVAVGLCAVAGWGQTEGTGTGDSSAAVAGEAEVGDRVTIAHVVQVSSQVLALRSPFLTVTAESGETRQAPVVLERQLCDVRAQVRLDDGPKDWAERVRCFELRPQDPKVPYAYSFWTGYRPEWDKEPQAEGSWVWPGSELRLFSLAEGETLLAGGGWFGWWMDVSKPNDRTEALKAYILSVLTSPPQPFSPGLAALKGELVGVATGRFRLVPAMELLGDEPFARAAGPPHVTIEEMSRDEAGNLVVRVKGIRSEELYPLIFDGTQWRKG